MATCAAVWSLYNECNATLNAMVLSASEADGVSDDPSSDPCATQLAEVYGLPLHVGAVLIVFLASLLGAGVPLLTKYHPGFAVDPYVVALGKCMGTGVVLACALVHMLQPASASLTSLCVPTAFNTDYTAYAFLFAMLAALAMQFMEFTLSAWLRAPTARSETPMRTLSMPEVGTSSSPSAASSTDATTFGCVCDDSSATASPQPNEYVPLTGSLVDAHALLLQAIMIEIGVTVHSIFIGLATGVVGENELKGLLIALSFHQFFEGIALGSRLADAHLPSTWHELALSIVFAIAAPVGLGVGIAVTAGLNPNGATFLLVQGIFDSVCAGMLLYLAFSLLFHDFSLDMKRHCAGKKQEWVLQMGMFGATWMGAGIMAFIGKYM